MIDHELMTREVEERQARDLRWAQAMRLVRECSGPDARPWTAALRSAVGIRVARLGLRLAGATAVRAA